MTHAKLDDMVKGWFIGNFDSSLHKTDEVEIAVKRYKKGDYEPYHYHKIATEFTVIVSGEAQMCDVKYSEGDIVIIYPGESTDFLAATDVVTVVAKIPGANSDKYQGRVMP